MNEKFTPSEMDPRRKPCVSIEFGMRGHETEYVLILRPEGIYGDAVDIPSDWSDAFRKKLGEGWNVMNRRTRFEIKPPFAEDDAFSVPLRTTETDRKVEEVLKSVLGEEFVFNFSPIK